jgi:hypothetical protein
VAGNRIDLARDFRDLLRAFDDREVRYLVVGAYALAALGLPRGTGDLDVWVEPTSSNAERVFAALEAFGAPLHDLTTADLTTPGVVFQIGVPPVRIDVLTHIDGVEFAAAWPRRLTTVFGGIRVNVIGRDDFLANKRAVGRAKDLADAERLERGAPRRTKTQTTGSGHRQRRR